MAPLFCFAQFLEWQFNRAYMQSAPDADPNLTTNNGPPTPNKLSGSTTKCFFLALWGEQVLTFRRDPNPASTLNPFDVATPARTIAEA